MLDDRLLVFDPADVNDFAVESADGSGVSGRGTGGGPVQAAPASSPSARPRRASRASRARNFPLRAGADQTILPG